MKKLVVSCILSLVCAFLSTPVYSALYSGPSLSTITDTDPEEDIPVKSKNIQELRVGADTGSYYFQMLLEGAPAANTFYGVYLGLPGNSDLTIENADYAAESVLRTKYSNYFWAYFTDYTGSKVESSIPGFRYENKVLEWTVAKTDIESSWFHYMGATSTSSGLISDTTAVAATPIPGAVWLLGSGLVGLIGLRRKNAA